MMAGFLSCKYGGCTDVILDNMQKKLMKEGTKKFVGLGVIYFVSFLPSFLHSFTCCFFSLIVLGGGMNIQRGDWP